MNAASTYTNSVKLEIFYPMINQAMDVVRSLSLDDVMVFSKKVLETSASLVEYAVEKSPVVYKTLVSSGKYLGSKINEIYPPKQIASFSAANTDLIKANLIQFANTVLSFVTQHPLCTGAILLAAMCPCVRHLSISICNFMLKYTIFLACRITFGLFKKIIIASFLASLGGAVATYVCKLSLAKVSTGFIGYVLKPITLTTSYAVDIYFNAFFQISLLTGSTIFFLNFGPKIFNFFFVRAFKNRK